MKRNIKTRDDVFLLVFTFYKKVRKDVILAAFFNNIKDWDEHLQILTNFWVSNLFLKTKYLGNPLDIHVKVDNMHGNTISQEHFGQQMNLWYRTIDELFEGEYANMAKNRARKMSTFLNLKIFEARQANYNV